MRIVFGTTAGVGHFGPMVPFARACADAGHEVRVAAPASFAATVAQAGLVHAPFPDAAPDDLGAVFGRLPQMTQRAANELVIREVFGRLNPAAGLPAVRALFEQWRPDLVVREPAELSTYVLAERLGVPIVGVNIGLDSLTDDLQALREPLLALGSPNGVDGLVELPRWSLAPASFDQAAARATSAPSRFGEVEPAKPATPLPAWWPDRDERPLVYVSFGSVAAGIGLFPGLYMRVLELMADLPVRVLLTLGQAGDPDALGSVPPNAHIERWWPQDQLRPHLAAVVGHGGFGTTLAALTAGIPQVVVPLFASDQFANATRVAAIGAGMALSEPDPLDRPAAEMLPRGPRTVEDLPAAVTRVLDDESVRQAARAVAAEIAGLPDVRTCTEFLAQLTGTG